MKVNKNKWVVGATSAALVAAAIVPVASAASFSDIEKSDHKEAILALAELNIVGGYTDGTFRPNAVVTRGNVTKFLGKWLVSEGYEIPADFDKEARFTDLPTTSKDQELVKFAALVKDAGVFKGSNNKLMHTNNMSREQMAVVLVRAINTVYGVDLVADYKAEKFESKITDLEKASADENREAIIALEYAELTNVKAFNPKNSLTRGQFASFLNRTITTIVKEEALTVKTVTVKDATTLEVTLSDDKTHTVTLPTALPANKETKVEFVIDGKTYSAVVTYVVAEYKVESVNAINGVTVEVKFTQAVDKADVANKVSIQGVTLTAPVLSEDGKTLTLTAAMTTGGGAIKVEDATVVVEAIKTKADKEVKLEKYVGKMTYEDKLAPSIVSVEALTNGNVAKTATIKFSEPVKAGALVKVNGAYATVTPFTSTSDTIELTGLSLEAGKTHTVEVINAEDTAGNKVVTMSADFTVAVDAATPVATVTAGGSDKEILVTFNKSMNVSKVAGITVKDETLSNINIGAITPVADTKGTQFTIAITDTVYTNKDSRTFSVVLPKDMEDKLGNKTTDSVQNVTLVKDVAKPVATGYNVVKDSAGKVEAIEVNFSEKVTVTTTPDFGSVVNENGVIDTTTFAGLTGVVSADGKKVVYTLSTAKTITGKFAISFAKDLVKDLSEAGNKSDAFNYTIDFGQGDLVSEFEIKTNLPTATGDVITVTFPEAVKGGAVEGSATDLVNYTLGGKPLPAATTITLDSTQKVATITLPVESIAKDDQASVFTVANVKNIAGTKTVKSFTGTVSVEDNTAPVLQSAKILDNKTIELTYSEAMNLTGDNVFDSFKIVQGTDTLALATGELIATVASGFENKLVLKVVKGSGSTATTLDLTKDITIETLNPTLKVVTDNSKAKNEHKKEVKVNVVKP
ncbi:S-layer homology domain-containing protein [Lysinibacillus contaminans]|uniref:S-layer homology domain-containing protein n=1 Tax=Lysinibacillus contaminans TaxID=1293441 RepID=UPI0006AE3728|nr:S-layer homology domain-containing protein [Lysinibacillus contaminans]